MQGDLLLQEWKQAKDICKKIIEICKQMHLGRGNVEGRVLAPGEKQTNKQFINVYDVVYRLCLTKEKEENRVLMVYKDYKELLKIGLLEMAPLINQEKDVCRLIALRKVWQAYCEMQKRLNNMFAYLNRSYHLKNDKIQNLDRTSTNIIAGTLFNEASVVEYQVIYFKQLYRVRQTRDMSNGKCLSNLVDIFYQIHSKILKHISNKKARTLFTQFYTHYQKKARDYYKGKFKTLKQISPSEYFIQINQLYQQEIQIAENCFVITADTLINRQFSEELVVNYKDILLTSEYGLKYILRQGQVQTLKLIVQINLKLTNSLEGFKQQFQEYIFEQMKNFIDENKIDLALKRSIVTYCTFMQKLIRKNDQLVIILEAISIVGDFVPYFKNGIQKAFTQSKTAVSIQQLLAIYTDVQLRKDMKEQQFEKSIKNIITIFNCAQNKDLFLVKYSQRLAKRILVINQNSLSNHEIFINNLKINCGIKYTETLETIITQYRISKDSQAQLTEMAQHSKLPIIFNLKIFSSGAWPTQTILQLNLQLLPTPILHAQQLISQYQNNHLNKKTLKISGLQSKIRWVYFFDPSIKNKNESCYFDTNCLQGIILFYLYRNRPNKIPFRILGEILVKVSPKLIKENLSKMVQVGQNVISREGQGEQALYQFNPIMKSIKKLISYDQGSSQQQQKLFQNHDLSKDRQIVLDANISKIMKAKKILDFRTLIEETVKMIRVFVPQPKDIKIAIDRLISKDLLQRDQKDREIIRYKD